MRTKSSDLSVGVFPVEFRFFYNEPGLYGWRDDPTLVEGKGCGIRSGSRQVYLADIGYILDHPPK